MQVTLLVTISAKLLLAAGSGGSFPATAVLKDGQVSSAGDSVRAFKGIPFAAPPVGDLRWKPPVAAKPWTGVRNGVDFAADCMQRPDVRLRAKAISEDCLYANVWTPAKRSDEKLPVMVFIYGGGFDHGSGSRLDYDGERLAAKGVVFVNFNYRVGIFGFLAHPGLTQESAGHSSGNYALMDQIAALKWVQANIAAFGGDPKKVMIFGQSAGAASVNLLLISPQAKGLFRAAISESPGGNQNLATLAEAEKTGAALGDLPALRGMSAAALMDAAKTGFNRPILDGWVIPRREKEAYATKQANLVPLIIGNNANELGPSVATTPIRTKEAYVASVRQRFGANADKVLAAYPVNTDEEAPAMIATLNADASFGIGVFETSAEVSAVNPNIYRYYFSRHRGDGPNAPIHFEEVSYVFNHLDSPSVPGDPPGGRGVMTRPPFNATDEKLRDTMMNIWVHFATTAEPNGPGLPEWPKYTTATKQLMDFSGAPHATPDTHAQQFELLHEALPTR